MTLPLPSLAHDGSNHQQILDLIAQAIPSGGVATAPRIVSGGKKNIATSESTTSTSYTTLTTPDTVTVTLPTDGLIAVWYQAITQATVVSNGRAAIFLGANQVKAGSGTGAAAVQEVTFQSEINDDGIIYTGVGGLAANGGAGAATEVTTGQIVGGAGTAGAPIYIFAAAGTYDVSIKFKNNAAGTLTAKNRHLWVASLSFA